MSATCEVATKIEVLALGKIRTDGGTQMRAKLVHDVCVNYEELILAGVELPPVDVFHDGKDLWLADGFHRYHGAKGAGKDDIKCNVHRGTARDAILFAIGANHAHGLMRTDDDKWNAVTALLNDEEWVLWSDRRIAEAAGVGSDLVGTVRKQLSLNDSSSPAAKTKDEPKLGKDGKKRKPRAAAPAAPVEQAAVAQEQDRLAGGPENDEPIKELSFEERVGQVNGEIESFCRGLETWFEDNCPDVASLAHMDRKGSALGKIRAACKTLRVGKLHKSPCPKCQGDGCKTCQRESDFGAVSAYTFSQIAR
jgi:uncharacterized ParB-like nuclease family protein